MHPDIETCQLDNKLDRIELRWKSIVDLKISNLAVGRIESESQKWSKESVI